MVWVDNLSVWVEHMILNNPFSTKRSLLLLSFVLIVGLLSVPMGVLGTETITTENDTDRPGLDISHFEMNPKDDENLCAQACLNNPNCSAYTYVKAGIQGNNPVCWLKKGVPDPKSDSCCISGIRKSTPKSIPTVVPSLAIIPMAVIPPSMDSPPSGQNVIDFEDLSSSGPGEGNQLVVSNQYANKGIIFNYPYPVVLDYSKGSNPSKYQGFTHSGTKAIEQCYGKEFCIVPVGMNFTSGQKGVKTRVGYSKNLPTKKTVVIKAFDSSGKQVKLATATLQPSTAPIPVNIPLDISSDSGNIFGVALYLTDDNGAIWPTNNLAVDDIELSTVGPVPECGSTQIPTVSITQPNTGAIVRNNVFNLRGTISTTAPLQSAQVIITGSGGSKSLNLLNNGILSPNGGDFSASGITDMLFSGSNSVIVKAQNCKGEGQNIITVIFTPCDSSTEPVVKITYPDPSQPEITIRSDDDKQVLNGTIISPSKITGVQVKVISNLPAGGMKSFDISTDDKGFFSIPLNSTNLFKGPNKIQVSATNSDGCLGVSSTNATFVNRILKRIAGDTFLQFTQGDPKDTHIADKGWEYISHNPGCGTQGNDGIDTFFSAHKPLPFWSDLKEVQFIRFQPNDVNSNTIVQTSVPDWGRYDVSYRTRGINLAQSLVEVEWHNTCSFDYKGKNIEYAISFIVSIPEDMTEDDLGEKLYDPSDTNPETHPGILKTPAEFYILK